MSKDWYLFWLRCQKNCTFTRSSPEPTGDARWQNETCIYDGSRLSVIPTPAAK